MSDDDQWQTSKDIILGRELLFCGMIPQGRVVLCTNAVLMANYFGTNPDQPAIESFQFFVRRMSRLSSLKAQGIQAERFWNKAAQSQR